MPAYRSALLILQQISNSFVPLDVLNNHYQPLARYDARLLDLHGDWATLALPPDASVSCLHWGSLVRFTFSDGQYRCEAEGIVVAHRTAEEVEAVPDSEQASESPCPSAAQPVCREVTVHLWQCQQREERRLGPRRWSRIAVLLRPEQEALPTHLASLQVPDDAAEECWESGWAVDLSANGMRLRTHVCLPLQQRVALQFALPARHDDFDEHSTMRSAGQAGPEKRRFTLTGRVLRSERTRTASSHQAMICFEQLTSEEGLALSRFLRSG